MLSATGHAQGAPLSQSAASLTAPARPAVTRSAPRPGASPAVAAMRTHARTFAQLGFPSGLSLEGLNSQRVVSFRLPAGAPIDSARVRLRLRFSRAAMPSSNLQLFANDVRLAVALRSEADTSGAVTVNASIPRTVLSGDYFTLTLKSSIATDRDRCLDQRLSLAYVSVEPASLFEYYAPVAGITTIRQVWSSLDDTVIVALPNRKLTPAEFRAAYTVGIAAENDGHVIRYNRLPAIGDLTIATQADLGAAAGLAKKPDGTANIGVLRFSDSTRDRVGIFVDAEHGGTGAALLEPQWTVLTGASSRMVKAAAPSLSEHSEDPSFQELGIVDLQRDLGGEATWQIPLDLRQFEPGRVPSRLEVRIVSAPNTNDRQLVFFAFLNGTLVRSSDINESGTAQLIEIRLPSSLLVTRNELRLVVQRHVPASDACVQLDYPVPTQILPSSRVVTTNADKNARVFTGVTARLSPESPLYLPDAALDAPADYLPLLVPLGRAFWSPSRAPNPTFYTNAAPAVPNLPFFVVGRPAGVELDAPVAADTGHFIIHRKNSTAPLLDISDLRAWSVAQVVAWNGQVGVQIVPAASRARLPDVPTAYDAASLVLADADSTDFRLNTSGHDASLLFNDGPTILERIRGDWILWTIFLVLVFGPLLVLAIRAVVKRTPRRQLQRRFDRTSHGS